MRSNMKKLMDELIIKFALTVVKLLKQTCLTFTMKAGINVFVGQTLLVL